MYFFEGKWRGLDIVVSKILLLAIVMLVGFLAAKTGYIKGLKNATSTLITRITLPLLVITTLSGQAKNVETQNTALCVFILGIVFVAILLLLGKFSTVLFRFDKKKSDVHTCLTAFGNTIFLGYPLLEAIWGPTAVFYAAFFSIANDLAAWTIGVLILCRGGKGTLDLKRLLNPATLSYVIGAIMFMMSVRMPGVIHDAAATVGNTTMVLSMLFLGATLAGVRFRELLAGFSSVTIVIIKMLLVPIGAFYALRWLMPALALPVDMLIIPIVCVELAMPCQSVFAILSQEFGGDTDYAATAICLTTAASLFTLPFICSFILKG